ncbi:MAG: diaminopimelate epimerase [Ruminococcaceae bacterium]|nr:diaminopimelate epimerase [Oscillospiraceae bacterium]
MLHFTKMQGLGNDYLYVFGEVPENIVDLCKKLSDRHFGAGSDGMIYISPSEVADFRMRIFNADGSEAKMCGNGIRCVGKYVYDKGYTDKTHLTVETLSGMKTLDLRVLGGKVKEVTVDMGAAQVEKEMRLSINSADLLCTPVSVGNPHAVVFVENAETAPVKTLGAQIEHAPAFPGGVNVEFVQVISSTELRMRVWERGSGVTMACGTGACASVAAAVKKGFCPFDTPIFVRLDGGTLDIVVSQNGQVTMTGPAEIVYEGDAIC